MAALTPTNVKHNTAGRWKETSMDLPAVSDGDTVRVKGLGKIVGKPIVQATGTAPVGADSIVVASVSGNTVTFQVDGTARTAQLFARGY